ncbi:MAG TPA: choice-of-anchor D domain-containing protein, partial [Candidatus Acidoferrales bacterium]
MIFSCLSLMSIAGCVGLTGAGTPPGKSSSNSNPSSLGTLAANATSLSFGNVVAGSSSAQTLTLTNTGGATVKISQATVSGAGFSVVGGMSSVSIPAGQNHAFEVQYTPTGAGTVSGSIFVTSDATNSPLGIALAATATAALAITSQPESQSVVSGHSASFAVVAAGTG